MAGMTIPNRIDDFELIGAISRVGKYGKTAVAEELGVRHSAVIYRFNHNPFLEEYFNLTRHCAKLEEELKDVEKIGNILRKSRKNPPYVELYKPAGMTHYEFFYYIKKYSNMLGESFNRLYDGSRKMKKETIENIENRIKRKPAGTPVCDIWRGRNVSGYLLNNSELKKKYVKKNGKIKIGRR